MPLKQHIYAGLIAKIQTVNKELATHVVQQSVQSLQEDLNNMKMYESVNSLLFLSELMNLSFLNSLSFFNLVDDLVAAIEASKNQNARLFLINVFSRSLPIFAYSLNEKVYHDFKKVLEKAKKYCSKNQMFNCVMEAHQSSRIQDKSLLCRLDFQQSHLIEQVQINFKLEINISEDKKFSCCEYLLPSVEESEKLYQDFYKK